MGVPVDTEFDRSRLAWWLVVFALTAVLAFVFYAFLGIFLLGLFVYYATRPIYKRFVYRSPSATLAAIGSLVAIALPVLVLISYTVIVGLNELDQLVGGNFVSFLEPYVDIAAFTDTEQLLATLRSQFASLSTDSVREAFAALTTYVGSIVTGLIYLFVVLALAFFLLRDGHRLAKWYRDLVGEDSTAYAFTVAVDQDLQTIYFGNILTAFAIAIIAAVTYNVMDIVAPGGLGVPSPTLLGLLTGVGSLIPVIGIKLVYFPIAIYIAAVTTLESPGQLWFPAAFVVVAFVVVDTLPELLLRPYISGRNLNVGMVMFAYILGPVLFGWYGLFLAPLLLVLMIQTARLILPDLVRGGEVRPNTPTAAHAAENEVKISESLPNSDADANTDASADADDGFGDKADDDAGDE